MVDSGFRANGILIAHSNETTPSSCVRLIGPARCPAILKLGLNIVWSFKVHISSRHAAIDAPLAAPLIDAQFLANGVSTIDHDFLTIDISCRFRSKENGCLGDVVGLAKFVWHQPRIDFFRDCAKCLGW
jgi:hypothetical protein